jgi:hypothetical protein
MLVETSMTNRMLLTKTQSLRTIPVVFVLLFILTSVAHGQSNEPDSLHSKTGKPPEHDTTEVADSAIVEAEPPVQYPAFYDREPHGIEAFTGMNRTIDLSGSTTRMYYSLRDALRPLTSFYALRFGPYGQDYGVTYLGLPPYLYSISPDHAGSYHTYRLSPSGLNDLRLFSIEQGDALIVELDSPFSPMASVSMYSSPPNQEDAITELSVFKGDYSFANTDVRFKQLVSDRFGWDFDVGIEKSNGYMTKSAKERENYNLNLHYKLTPKWQISSRIRFLTTDDQMAQSGLWSGISASRDDFFRSIELEAITRDSADNVSNGFISYQTFEEKIRSSRFNLWQKHDALRTGVDIVRNTGSLQLHATSRLLYNRMTFDYGYDYYTRINADGGLGIFPERKVSFFLIARYLYDWGDVSRFGAGARVSLRATESLSAYISGDISNVPPTDMARFLKPSGYDINGDGAPEYNHGGDRDLEPATVATVSGSAKLDRDKYSLVATGRISRITDMVIWQRYEGVMGGLYQSEAHDADLHALTVHGSVSPFGQLTVSSDYTYARLSDRNGESNLSLMPRHNLYGSITWKQHIGSLRLDVFPSLEAEYHSGNLRSHFNTADLEPYLVMHGGFSVKIKSFTFYYTMENIFNKTYETVDGYPSFRSVWWGFRWIFLN